MFCAVLCLQKVDRVSVVEFFTFFIRKKMYFLKLSYDTFMPYNAGPFYGDLIAAEGQLLIPFKAGVNLIGSFHVCYENTGG